MSERRYFCEWVHDGKMIVPIQRKIQGDEIYAFATKTNISLRNSASL